MDRENDSELLPVKENIDSCSNDNTDADAIA
jgi:hypothetical protein